MRTLDRKLLRNLLTMKGQVLAIVLIIACGVASFVTMLTAYRGLNASRDAYYARYRMADVFASVERAPRTIIDQLQQQPGVRRVQGRIVFDVTLDIPAEPQPVSGRIISVPDRQEPALCDLHLVSGDWFTGDGTGEVILAKGFADAHDLRVGDTLSVLMNNRKQDLRIVATALSPEFVYMVRGGGEIMPDPGRFTILWTSTSFAEAVFDFKEAINGIVATTDPDIRIEAVLDGFDEALDRYGGPGSHAREDQISNRILSQEIQGLEASVTLVPVVFLGIAAFILHVLISRLVSAQRSQIAIMRAFGYGRRQVSTHYLKFALIVGALGALLGIGAGLLMARGLLGVYQDFFNFPILAFAPDPIAILGGAGTSLGFAALGTAHAVRQAARLDPAEGLRPPAPSSYGKTLLERIAPLWRALGFAPRMVLRHISRNKLRSAITALAVSLATMITLFSFFIFSAWDQIVDVQYRLVERQDANVYFHRKRGRSALYEVRGTAGVLAAEPELLVGVEFRHGRKLHKTVVRGLEPGGELRALLDSELRRVQVPEAGLVLAKGLARLLDVRAGDMLDVRVLEAREPRLRVPVLRVVEEYMGANAYADIRTLSRWVDEEYAMSGVLLRSDPKHRIDLGTTLKDLPSVSAVTFKKNTVETLRATVQQSQQTMNIVILLFAGIIAFGVLYNTARISLAQRGRELGSMRILGFSHREVGTVLAGEGLVLTALGLLPGLVLGTAMAAALAEANQNELFSFPFVMPPVNYVFSAAVIFLFSILANALVLRRLRRADVIEVLKTRE